MKKTLLATALLFLSAVMSAQHLPADNIIGTWENVGSDVGLKFEIFRSGDKYFGKLIWASTMYEADGKTPKKDFNNPDKNLRSRSRKNMMNITNLSYKDGEYVDGKLYNPDDGDTYSLKARLKSINEMDFRGYVGISLLGKTMKFKRVQ